MTLAQCQALVGRPDPDRAITYRPHPWCEPADAQAGVIIGVNEAYVLVRYAGMAQPKATDPRDLTPVSPPGTS
jgi:hypothetical protein